jgi:hypothetical protein
MRLFVAGDGRECKLGTSAVVHRSWNGRRSMKKILLLSIIIAAIAIPARAARIKDPRRGFKKMVVQTALFNVFYLIVLIFIWGRL